MMELHTNNGDGATQEQKLKDFSGFLNTTTKINSSYFVSNKGFALGDSKQKAIGVYGNPDKQALIDGVEKLEWSFVGAISYDGKIDFKGKPLAENSFGHQVIMYFKSDKLVGLVLHNDIP